jgi:cell division protein FtsQ
VSTIDTDGLERLRYEDVLRLTGIDVGENLFLLEERALESKVELHPLVALASAQKQYPDRLVLHIEERTAVAVILTGNRTLEVDQNGVIIHVYESWPRGGLPVVTGIEVDRPIPGNQVDTALFRSILDLIAEAPPELLPLIDEIHANALSQIIIFLTTRKEVRLGKNDSYTAKLILLNEMLKDEEYRVPMDWANYIDLTSSKPALGQ